MIYGYARVSTAKQMKNGNSINDQTKALIEAGAEKIVSDDYTGTKMDRPQFTKLIESLQSGDKLIVTKLDRFARTAIEGSQVVRDLVSRGVTVHVLNMGIADNTPMGKLMITMLLAFAEFERDMIVERTQAGKAIARANGKKVDGRSKKYSEAKMNHAIDLLSEGNSYTEVEKMTGISKSTLIREKARREGLKAMWTKETGMVVFDDEKEQPKETKEFRTVKIVRDEPQEPKEMKAAKIVYTKQDNSYHDLPQPQATWTSENGKEE